MAKKIADKHAEHFEEFSPRHNYETVESIIDSLTLLEHMQNLKKVQLLIYKKNSTIRNIRERDINQHWERVPILNLPKLKTLGLQLSISLPFLAFQDCNSIEKLHIDLFFFKTK